MSTLKPASATPAATLGYLVATTHSQSAVLSASLLIGIALEEYT